MEATMESIEGFKPNEREKALAILNLLEGMTIAEAQELLDKCKYNLRFQKLTKWEDAIE